MGQESYLTGLGRIPVQIGRLGIWRKVAIDLTLQAETIALKEVNWSTCRCHTSSVFNPEIVVLLSINRNPDRQSKEYLPDAAQLRPV